LGHVQWLLILIAVNEPKLGLHDAELVVSF
jgi:hypothetical protein